MLIGMICFAGGEIIFKPPPGAGLLGSYQPPSYLPRSLATPMIDHRRIIPIEIKLLTPQLLTIQNIHLPGFSLHLTFQFNTFQRDDQWWNLIKFHFL